MYPFDYETGIVRNRWYIAAFSYEITREPIERTLLDTPVVLYRTEDGTPVAMYGLCPHRYFPLAKGWLDGDVIVCGYHGFEFAADGSCTRIPSQEVPGKFCQPTYPVIERGPLCWIYIGDPQQKDKVSIPPYDDFGLGQDGWRYSSENYFRLKGRAQLLVDNLMDLTHLPYVHHHIPGGEAMANPDMEATEREHSYQLIRRSKVPFTPFHEIIFGPDARFEGLSEFESVTDFYGPEFIRTSLPVTKSLDSGQPVPDGIGELYILHGITPETEHSTHYFGFSTRNFRLNDESVDEFQRESDCKIRQQDVDAINAVEQRIDFGAARHKEMLVVADRPVSLIRKRIENMIAEEQSKL